MTRLSPVAAFAFAVSPPDRLALAVLAGEVTGDDMRRVVEAVHDDPEWEPGFDAIWDCSRVRAHVVSPEEVRPLVRAAVEGEPGRDVLVESPRLGESFFSEMLVRTVRAAGDEGYRVHTLDEALDLLGLDDLPDALRAVADAEAGA